MSLRRMRSNKLTREPNDRALQSVTVVHDERCHGHQVKVVVGVFLPELKVKALHHAADLERKNVHNISKETSKVA